MSTKMESLEREVKLGAALDLALPDLRELVGTERLAEQELRAWYFDTPDLRLWIRGITFRYRTGEGPRGGLWTLKLPEDGAERTINRTELSWSGPSDQIPPEARGILRGITRHRDLGQVVGLTTTRKRLVLRAAEGKSMGELDDDTVVVSGGPNDGLRFRQLELELAGEEVDGDVFKAVIDKLQRAGAHLEDDPKMAKALGRSGQSRRQKDGQIGPHSSLGDVVRASITNGVDRLLDHDYRLRLDLQNPSAHDVHQARVATRRMRSDLKTLRPVLDPIWLKHTRDELQWLGAVLGHVRDADVLLTLFDSGRSAMADIGQIELLSGLRGQRRSACREMAEALEGDRYLHLLERLDTAAQWPPFLVQKARGMRHHVKPGQRAFKALPRLVHIPWRSLTRKVHKAGGHPTDRELHKIRIAAKQLRYAAELATPVMGKSARRTALAAEQLQTVLGDHHDAVSAEAWLSDGANRTSSRASFSAGQLMAIQAQRQRKLRRRWRPVWAKLSKKKVHRWLQK